MFWKLGKRVLREKGRVVDGKNHNELRGFLDSPAVLSFRIVSSQTTGDQTRPCLTYENTRPKGQEEVEMSMAVRITASSHKLGLGLSR